MSDEDANERGPRLLLFLRINPQIRVNGSLSEHNEEEREWPVENIVLTAKLIPVLRNHNRLRGLWIVHSKFSKECHVRNDVSVFNLYWKITACSAMYDKINFLIFFSIIVDL